MRGAIAIFYLSINLCACPRCRGIHPRAVHYCHTMHLEFLTPLDPREDWSFPFELPKIGSKISKRIAYDMWIGVAGVNE
jgi:hypothetical protein